MCKIPDASYIDPPVLHLCTAGDQPQGWQPQGGFELVGGHGDVIRQLREMVLLPLQYPQLHTHMGIAAPRGLLLHGPPGTGKTLLVRALAGMC